MASGSMDRYGFLVIGFRTDAEEESIREDYDRFPRFCQGVGAGVGHVGDGLSHVEAGLSHVEAGLGHVGTGLGYVGAGLGPVEAGGAGGVGAIGVTVAAVGVAQAGDDRLGDLLRQFLERLPGAVPVQAPVLPRVAEVQPRATVVDEGAMSVRKYNVEFNRLLGYAGRSLEDEQAQIRRFLRRLRIDLKTWCRGIRFISRAELVETVAQIEENLREQAAVVVPAVQPRRPQQQVQQVGPSKGGMPAQGHKRNWEDTSRSGQSGRGCYGCGSLDQKRESCPKQNETRAARVCY
ncbi:hypothetical protein AALP_AA7G105500 [Arabis alpina]|uniref:Retrotransposon gag domain-containing protein n=1 Tax=Arabis alpina TaxID=50452 RepID=A0A087GH72_ARAAL|nr:hypothetical protein AALP_AA7G105500 [Arabis alpina]